jgi:hypothetical protein
MPWSLVSLPPSNIYLKYIYNFSVNAVSAFAPLSGQGGNQVIMALTLKLYRNWRHNWVKEARRQKRRGDCLLHTIGQTTTNEVATSWSV